MKKALKAALASGLTGAALFGIFGLLFGVTCLKPIWGIDPKEERGSRVALLITGLSTAAGFLVGLLLGGAARPTPGREEPPEGADPREEPRPKAG